MTIEFQLQVDKNCNATPIAQQQIQPIGPPGSSVNQNVSASLTSNAIRQQTADAQNPHIHYMNMQKQNQAAINSGGAANKVIMCDVFVGSFAHFFLFPPTQNMFRACLTT